LEKELYFNSNIFDEDLKDLLSKMMAKEPEKRIKISEIK
jgi:serine/threonine protein kinase